MGATTHDVVAIELPDAAGVPAVGRSLADRGYPSVLIVDGEITTHDRWGTAIRIRIADHSTEED